MQLENVEDVYALAPIQEGMLFHSIAAPNSGVFIEQVCCTIHGPLDISYFQQAWDDVVIRHAALRTVFPWDGLDEPLQVVHERVEIPWTLCEWRGTSAEQLQQKTADLLRTDRRRGFDLASAPLMRMVLVRETDDRVRFIWTFHHVLCDGWSTARIIEEAFAIYAAKVRHDVPSLEAPFPYKNFIAYLQSKNLDAAERYWRDRLSGFSRPTRLYDYAVASKLENSTQPSARQVLTLSTPLSDQLRAFARSNRLTLNSVVLGAWALLLSCYTGEEDIVFGTTVSGRPHELTGVDAAIGLFINTLPLRIRVGDAKLVDWLQEIQRQQIGVREFETTPLSLVQRCSDISPGEPLFESIVVFENYPEASGDNRVGITVDDFDYHEQSNYPLALLVVPGRRMDLYVIHETARFTTGFAKNLLSRVRHLLESFVNAPRSRLSEHGLLSEREQNQLLTDWNETHVDLDGEQTMHGLIEKNANETPDAIAVVSENTSLTYRELDESANLLAAQLISAGVRSNDHVGLFLERSLDMVVGILGILKAGAAFVPLDPTYPTAHLRYIASDAQVAAIVTQQRLRAAVPYLDARVIELDSPPTAVRATAVNRPVLAENTAYVLYTSGSEGRPKGVPVSHCNLVHSTLARQHFYREPVDRFLLLSSLAFDSAMVGIFWTLVDGGTLVLPPPRLEQDLDKLTALLSSQQVSHVLCLPSLYEIVLQHARKDQLQTLRTVIVAGETCTPSTLTRHLAVVPWAKLFNEYGPTEATVWCVACELTEASVKGPIPIGRPIANTQVYLLDRHGRPVPPGICGELFVAGPGVTKGYWNQPELTKKRFAQNPFSNDSGARMYRTGDLAYYLPDGKLVFAGRHDHQVKIRGYRIELGEIESKLRQHPNVKEAVVVAPAVRNSSPEDVPLDSDEIVDRLLALGPTRAGRLLDEVLAIPSDDMDGQLARDFP